MSSTPHKLFREVLGDTGDPLAAIRAVREVFGLSVPQAKEVWLQATGRAETLSAHQEELAAAVLRIVCPKCRSDATVEQKLHALPVGVGAATEEAGDTPGARFVNGFWCSACQIGFVPNQLLDELGLTLVRP